MRQYVGRSVDVFDATPAEFWEVVRSEFMLHGGRMRIQVPSIGGYAHTSVRFTKTTCRHGWSGPWNSRPCGCRVERSELQIHGFTS